MLKSQIIEAASFTPNRVDFNIPSSLCTGIKVVDLGVFGGTGNYPLDPVLGQLAVIKSIRLTENGQVLSQYDRRFSNLMQYKMFQENNTKQRCINRKLAANNYGLVVNNAGADVPAINPAGIAAVKSEAQVTPRICIDKKDLSRVLATQKDTKLAMLNLNKVLGFMNAQWDSSKVELMGYVPCHLFKNLKLSIEFNAPASVATNATTVAQPYLIMDVMEDPEMEKAFMGKQAEWIEHELEEVFIDNNQQANNFLNSFYGKTLANLHVLVARAGVRLSPNLDGESLNLLVNQVPIFQQSGIDSLGKRAAFTQMALGGDLYIPLTSDREPTLVPDSTSAADGALGLFEGPANATAISSNYFAAGACSYLALPIQQKINSLQLRYSRTGNDANTYLLFFGEVAKVLQMDPKSGAPVVSYV